MDKRKTPMPSTRPLTLHGKQPQHHHQQVAPGNHSGPGATTNATSDSDGSAETNSLSAESNAELATINAINTQVQIVVQQGSGRASAATVVVPPPAAMVGRSKKGGSGGGGGRRRSSEWEIMEGLKDGQKYDKKPTVYSGYLHKKRKWPLKGWHKNLHVNIQRVVQ